MSGREWRETGICSRWGSCGASWCAGPPKQCLDSSLLSLPLLQQQQFDTIEEEASSRASSPSKSPLGQAPEYLEQEDAPLARLQAGPSARRLASGARGLRIPLQQAGLDAQQQPPFQQRPQQQFPQQLHQQHQHPQVRPLDLKPLELPMGGSSIPRQPRPSSPSVTQSQYDQWVAQGMGDGGAAAGEGARGPARAAPGGRRAALFEQAQGRPPAPAAAAFGGAAVASDPMTYNMQAALDKDGVPNIGDVELDEPPVNDWRIGAQRTTTRGGGSRYSPMPSQGVTPGGTKRIPEKPGAAVKMGRRQAWLKFLAYEVGEGQGRGLACEARLALMSCHGLPASCTAVCVLFTVQLVFAQLCRDASSCAWRRCWAMAIPARLHSCRRGAGSSRMLWAWNSCCSCRWVGRPGCLWAPALRQQSTGMTRRRGQ